MDIQNSFSSPDIRPSKPMVHLHRDENISKAQSNPIRPLNASASTPVVLAHHSISFRSDEESGRDFFVIIDKETDKVIKQYPPEDLIHLARELLKKGSLYHQKI